MGFKTDLIILNSSIKLSKEEFLKKFGFENVKLNRSSTSNGKFYFDNPKSVVIGIHPNYTILFGGLAQKHFSNKIPSEIEQQISNDYVSSEILALYRYDVSNSYLFNYIKNGKRIRFKCGDYDEEALADYGDKLDEEAMYQEILDENNNKLYRVSRIRKNPKTGEKTEHINDYTHDQVGGEIAFQLFKRFTGYNYSDAIWGKDVVYFEFITSETLTQLRPIKRTNLTSIGRILYKYNFLETSKFKTSLKNIISPELEEIGFTFNSDNLEYIRSINDIKHIISLADHNAIGRELTKISEKIFRIESSHLKNWWYKEFGSLVIYPSNTKAKVTDYVYLNTLFYNDNRTVKVLGTLDDLRYDKLTTIIKSYIFDTIIPFFDHYSNHKNIARGIIGHRKIRIEYLLSVNLTKEAKKEIQEYLIELNYPNYDNKYLDSIEYLENRVKKYFSNCTLESLWKEVIEVAPQTLFNLPIENVIIDLQSFDKDKISEPVNSENLESAKIANDKPKKIQEIKSKKWWQFWLI